MSEALALEASGLTKRFGALLALDAVSLQLRPGTVHALLGENGAGKSTLVKCIMGYYQADEGAVRVGGADTAIKSPRDAATLGIGMVYQHFTLVDNMTVAENLVLARRALPFVFDWKAEHQDVAAFMERMPFSLDPGRPVRTLAAGEKQKLEILKQLYLGSSIVILDEPTSVLTPDEADEVLGLLRNMAMGGKLTILMISHKFREVMKFADEVTILRRGRWVGGGNVADLTPEAMARMMVGEDPPRANQQRSERAMGEVVLDIRSLRALDDLGTPAVVDFNLRVHAGEIVGVAGVSGNGQEELVEVLAGQRIARAGTVVVNGKDYRARRDEMRTQRVRCLPDEPLRNACVGAMTVAENIGFRLFDRDAVRARAHPGEPAGAAQERARADRRVRHPRARPRRADRQPVGRQRPAGGAGARAARRRLAAGGEQPLLRARLRRGRRDPLAPGRRAQPRRRGLVDQRGSRRDLRAVRPHRGHERGARCPRGADRRGRPGRHRPAHGRA